MQVVCGVGRPAIAARNGIKTYIQNPKLKSIKISVAKTARELLSAIINTVIQMDDQKDLIKDAVKAEAAGLLDHTK